MFVYLLAHKISISAPPTAAYARFANLPASRAKMTRKTAPPAIFPQTTPIYTTISVDRVVPIRRMLINLTNADHVYFLVWTVPRQPTALLVIIAMGRSIISMRQRVNALQIVLAWLAQLSWDLTVWTALPDAWIVQAYNQLAHPASRVTFLSEPPIAVSTLARRLILHTRECVISAWLLVLPAFSQIQVTQANPAI